jgi:hypothetical protein
VKQRTASASTISAKLLERKF